MLYLVDGVSARPTPEVIRWAEGGRLGLVAGIGVPVRTTAHRSRAALVTPRRRQTALSCNAPFLRQVV